MASEKNLTLKQSLFKKHYLDPESATYGDALASALRAGYPEEYAKKLDGSGVDFASELVRDFKRLSAAEKVLSQTLAFVDDEDVGRQKLAQDSAKFIAKTLGRKKYAERVETDVTSGGKVIPILASLNEVPSNNSTPQDKGA